MAITSQQPAASFPLTLEITSGSLPKRSWVKTSQVRILSVERLTGRLSRVSPEELSKAVSGLNAIIGD